VPVHDELEGMYRTAVAWECPPRLLSLSKSGPPGLPALSPPLFAVRRSSWTDAPETGAPESPPPLDGALGGAYSYLLVCGGPPFRAGPPVVVQLAMHPICLLDIRPVLYISLQLASTAV
jgi:hypothetical protein